MSRRNAQASARLAQLEAARAAELHQVQVLKDAEKAYSHAHAVTVECELTCASHEDISVPLPAGIEHERTLRLEAPVVARAMEALGTLSRSTGDSAAQVVFRFFADTLGQVERGETLPDGVCRIVEVLGLAKGPVLTSAGKRALALIR